MSEISPSLLVQNRRPAILPALSTQTSLLIIIVFAVILRIGSALIQGNEVQALPGIHDQISYDLLARRLVAGAGFSFAGDHWPLTHAGEPTAHWSYLYTLYLAMLYGAGLHPLSARLVQAAIAGLFHSWLAFRIGRRLGGPAVGLATAALSAGYIYFFYYAGALMTETFYIIGILWTLDCALRLAEAGRPDDPSTDSATARWGLWLQLGLAIGVTALLRQVFLLFVPFLFLWLWWNRLAGSRAAGSDRRPSRVDVVAGTLLATLTILLLILPWTIRNYQAFHMFVPLNTNAGYALFWGNHPIYGTRFVGILPDDGPSYQELIPEELRHLNEAELDRALLKEGVSFIVDDPVRYVLLSMSRTREYFKFWPSPDSSLVSNVSRVASFGLLLPFMVYGLWVGLKRIRHPLHPHQRAGIILLLLFIFIYSTIHLLTWALIRYRLPVDAVLVVFAATGVVDLAEHLGFAPRREALSPRPLSGGLQP